MINLKIALKRLGLGLKTGGFLSTPVALRTTLEESVEGEVCLYMHTCMQGACFCLEYFPIAVHTVSYWVLQVQFCSCCFVNNNRLSKNRHEK